MIPRPWCYFISGFFATQCLTNGLLWPDAHPLWEIWWDGALAIWALLSWRLGYVRDVRARDQARRLLDMAKQPAPVEN